MRELDSVYKSHPIPSMPRLSHHHPRPAGESMLAYTERMREISKFRTDPAFVGGDSPASLLEVQAQRIPKAGVQLGRHGGKKMQNNVKPRRPMSLDELIGRPVKKDEMSAAANAARLKERRMSEPGLIPPLISTPQGHHSKDKDEKRIRISFVSAADLFDLVDFSLRSRKAHNDNLKLARAEDTVRLIHEANYFRSIANRQKMKATDREQDVDKASLIVQGTCSTLDSPKDRSEAWANREEKHKDWASKGEKHGDWARKEVQGLTDPYDSDDERGDDQEEEEETVHLDFDLLSSRRMMLLQPPKLRFRPKRAKRMRLHRSLLSAIPEDERNRQGDRSAHAQRVHEMSSSHLPVVPTSSSLSAIKGSRKLDAVNVNDGDIKNTPETHIGSSNKGSTENLYTADSMVKNNHELCGKDESQNKHLTEDNELREVPLESSNKNSPRQSPRKKDSPRRTTGNARTHSLNGQNVLPETINPRAKAQKKIRKLIFLRDQPDHSYHRYP